MVQTLYFKGLNWPSTSIFHYSRDIQVHFKNRSISIDTIDWLMINWHIIWFKSYDSYAPSKTWSHFFNGKLMQKLWKLTWSYKFTKLNSITNFRYFFAFKAFVRTGNICSSYSLLRSYWWHWQKATNLNSLNFQISNLFRHSFLSGHVHMNRNRCEISTRRNFPSNLFGST